MAAATLALASCANDDTTGSTATRPTRQPVPQTPPSLRRSLRKNRRARSRLRHQSRAGDGALTVGYLLPTTGDLAFLGPPEIAGVNLAVKEINAAGGVLGKPVSIVPADSGDGTPPSHSASVDKLLGKKSDVIIGAASSSVSLSVIDKIVNARRRPLLPRQHVDGIRHLRRQEPLLPDRTLRRPPGCRACQHRGQGRVQERCHSGSPRLLW
ncbi:MAG: ABC transporter substrate-binding protein [Nocardioidaceae bacterium]